MSTRAREDLQWLMDFFGTEGLTDISRLTGDISPEQEALLKGFAAEHLPAHLAILAASTADRPAVVQRILAEESAR